MKPTKLLILAALFALPLSCAKETQNDNDLIVDGFDRVSVRYDAGESKTVLASDGTTVLWSPNDSIGVYCNGNGQKFTAINSTAKAWTVFGSDKGLKYGGSGDDSIWGVYPYSSENVQEDDNVTLTVPSEQVAVEGSFGAGSFAAVGKSTSTEIVFYNVCGGIRFTLTQAGIRKIKFYGNDGETLAGKVKVRFVNNIPAVSNVLSGSSVVTLSAPAGGEFQTGKWYYVSTIPVKMNSGFTAEFIKRANESERGYKSYSSSREIKRSVFGSVDGIDKNVEFSIEITEVRMSQTSLTIKPDATYQLTYSLIPEDAPVQSAVWSSSNEDVATVSQSGLVTAKAYGSAVISATVGKCVGTTDVLVANDAITSITLAPKNVFVYEDCTSQITKTTVPATSSETVTWSSADESIATVDQNGLVTGVSNGNTTITCSSQACSTSVNVYVLSNKITSIALSPTSSAVGIGGTVQISAQTFPSGVTETINWSSDDTAVATVDSKGLVTGVAFGSTVIRATTSKVEATMTVDVCSGLSLTRVDAIRRIENNSTYTDDTEPIRVARGETAIVQMRVNALEALSNPTIEMKYFGTSSDQTLVTPRIYWQRQVTSSRNWADWAGGAPSDEYFAINNLYYDPLMPQDVWAPTSVAKGSFAALWCELDIPRTFTPGTYEGVIKVSAGSYEGTKKFTVQVYDVTLPETQTMTVINWETGGFKEMHGGTADDMYSVRDKYMPTIIKFMNDYGQNAWRLLPYSSWEEPQSGKLWGKVGTDGKIVYVFSNMEKEIKMIDANATNLKQIHGLQFVHLRSGAYGVKLPYVKDDGTIGTKEYKTSSSDFNTVMAEFGRQLKEFLSGITLSDGRTAWSIYVQTICDEPTDEYASAYTKVARALKSGAPDLKVTDAVLTSEIATDALDYPCPMLNLVETYRASGTQEQWLYTSMGPQGTYANRFVRIPLIKTRLIHWCNYYYDAPAYLHWGLKYWEGCSDPYGDVAGQIVESGEALPGGDSHIIYPGDNVVYPSIRLCAMRDGIRDFDLLTMLKAKNPTLASSVLGKVIKGAGSYNTDAANFRAARKEMLEELSK